MKTGLKDFLILSFFGVIAGIINALFGTGGGIIIIFALMLLLKDKIKDKKIIFANSLAVIFVISAISAVLYSSKSQSAPIDFIKYIIPAILGGAAGAYLLGKINFNILQISFSILVIYSGASMIFG